MDQVFVVIGNDGNVADNFEWVERIYASYDSAQSYVESKGFAENEPGTGRFFPKDGSYKRNGVTVYSIECMDVEQ